MRFSKENLLAEFKNILEVMSDCYRLLGDIAESNKRLEYSEKLNQNFTD